jgi:hypothetical protein
MPEPAGRRRGDEQRAHRSMPAQPTGRRFRAGAMITPEVDDAEDVWQSAGDIAQQTLVDLSNKSKDKADEALDAKRTHGGQTLDEFLAGQ